MKLLDIFRKKKSMINAPNFFTNEAKITNSDRVDIYDNEGELIKQEQIGDKEKRMIELLDIISKAGQTEKYLISVTIHDPENKLGIGGGDLHHFTFMQDFPKDDRYGCLDKYAELLGLGDR